MSVCVWDIGKGPFVGGLVNAAICGQQTKFEMPSSRCRMEAFVQSPDSVEPENAKIARHGESTTPSREASPNSGSTTQCSGTGTAVSFCGRGRKHLRLRPAMTCRDFLCLDFHGISLEYFDFTVWYLAIHSSMMCVRRYIATRPSTNGRRKCVSLQRAARREWTTDDSDKEPDWGVGWRLDSVNDHRWKWISFQQAVCSPLNGQDVRDVARSSSATEQFGTLFFRLGTEKLPGQLKVGMPKCHPEDPENLEDKDHQSWYWLHNFPWFSMQLHLHGRQMVLPTRATSVLSHWHGFFTFKRTYEAFRVSMQLKPWHYLPSSPSFPGNTWETTWECLGIRPGQSQRKNFCTYESMIQRFRWHFVAWQVHTLAFAGNGIAMASGSEAADVPSQKQFTELM